jgi:hypothetical protein
VKNRNWSKREGAAEARKIEKKKRRKR